MMTMKVIKGLQFPVMALPGGLPLLSWNWFEKQFCQASSGLPHSC
jgi:hypothetical protein